MTKDDIIFWFIKDKIDTALAYLFDDYDQFDDEIPFEFMDSTWYVEVISYREKPAEVIQSIYDKIMGRAKNVR